MAKVLISLDDELLRRIDRTAKSYGISRSAYLARLAAKDTASEAARTAASRKGALERLDRLFAKAPPGDSTAIIRAERDAR
jgi:metal-responsive CopG/Arc/MetJ family transcriptional regulator